MLSTNFKI